MNVSLALGPSTVFVLIILVIFLILFIAAWARIERGQRPALRSLLPLHKLQRLIGQSSETGQTIHFSPGSGGLGNRPGTAETLSGLTSLTSVARVAARTKGTVTVTANDTLAYLAADDVVQAQYVQAGRQEDYRRTGTRFITQDDKIGYIAGVQSLLGEQNMAGNVMLGRLDSEYLLAGDQSNRRDLPQVVGTSVVAAMPLMLASAGPESTLLGEEMFAAPAYLDRQPAHLASVVAQDALRLLVIVVIVAGVIAASVGLVTNLGDYFLR